MSLTESQLAAHSESPEELPETTVSHQEMHLACVKLISELEILISSSGTRLALVSRASAKADQLLTVLLDFCDECLNKENATRAFDDIEKASVASLDHRELESTLSLGTRIRNIFGKPTATDERMSESYSVLGENLLAASVSVLRQAVATVGFNTMVGKSIEQSAGVFVEEFRANWSCD